MSKGSMDISSNGESTEEGAPDCPICKGAGFVYPLLPSGRPNFKRLVPCECRQAETDEERISYLRRESGDLALKLLKNMTFENFDPNRANLPVDKQRNLGDAYKLARGFAEEPEGWVVLQGPNGCGKTHLAAAIGNYQLQRSRPVFFKVVPDFLDYLRSAFKPESGETYDELFERVRNTPLLILDDFGEQASTPWAQEKLYQVINYRYNDRLPTVITTSLSLEELENRIGSRFGDPKVSIVFNISVPDYRLDLAPSDKGRRGRSR